LLCSDLRYITPMDYITTYVLDLLFSYKKYLAVLSIASYS